MEVKNKGVRHGAQGVSAKRDGGEEGQEGLFWGGRENNEERKVAWAATCDVWPALCARVHGAILGKPDLPPLGARKPLRAKNAIAASITLRFPHPRFCPCLPQLPQTWPRTAAKATDTITSNVEAILSLDVGVTRVWV